MAEAELSNGAASDSLKACRLGGTVPNAAAIAYAEAILAAANKRAGGERSGDPATRAARWVTRDAIRELTSDEVQARLAKASA